MSTRTTIPLAPGIEVTVAPRERRWISGRGPHQRGHWTCSDREMTRYTRIFVWVQNETVGDQLVLRGHRPYQAWRSMLVEHVLTPIGMGGAKLRWDRHCGCSMCPCSPGFVTDRHMGLDGPVGKHSYLTVDFHVTIDAEALGVPVAYASQAEIDARVEAVRQALKVGAVDA